MKLDGLTISKVNVKATRLLEVTPTFDFKEVDGKIVDADGNENVELQEAFDYMKEFAEVKDVTEEVIPSTEVELTDTPITVDTEEWAN